MGNNNQPERRYEKEFKGLLQAVFGHRAYFRDFFGGGIEALDGVKENETAFSVKTNDMPVVIGTYDTGADVAFGAGTANSTRFGERKEVIYANTDVPYTWNWAIHEGIDRFTVNNEFNAAIADRLDLQANAKIEKFNAQHSSFVSENAGEIVDASAHDGVLELFNELAVYFTNAKTIGARRAKVTPELYNQIVDHPAATIEKRSSANIDDNTVVKFKSFYIEELPEDAFQDGEIVYAYIAGVGKAFTGISTARTMESEDFDGVALQGAGLAGEYIPEDNKAAVVKVTGTLGTGGGVEG